MEVCLDNTCMCPASLVVALPFFEWLQRVSHFPYMSYIARVSRKTNWLQLEMINGNGSRLQRQDEKLRRRGVSEDIPLNMI